MKYIKPFNNYNKIYEKSVLDKFGIPNKVMVDVQKKFKIKNYYKIVKNTNKKIISNILKQGDMIIVVNKDIDKYQFIFELPEKYKWFFADTKSNLTYYRFLTYDNDKIVSKGIRSIGKIYDEIEIIDNTKIYKIDKGDYFFELYMEYNYNYNEIKTFIDYYNNKMLKRGKELFRKKWMEFNNSFMDFYKELTSNYDDYTNSNSYKDERMIHNIEDKLRKFYHTYDLELYPETLRQFVNDHMGLDKSIYDKYKDRYETTSGINRQHEIDMKIVSDVVNKYPKDELANMIFKYLVNKKLKKYKEEIKKYKYYFINKKTNKFNI